MNNKNLKKTTTQIAIPSSTETDRVPRKKNSNAYNKTLAIFFNVHNTLTIIHLLLLNSNLHGKFIN